MLKTRSRPGFLRGVGRSKEEAKKKKVRLKGNYVGRMASLNRKRRKRLGILKVIRSEKKKKKRRKGGRRE